MNFHANAAEIRQKLKAGTVEMPPPPHKPVTGSCWVPEHRIIGGIVDNDYCEMKLNGVSLQRHVVAAALKRGEIPEGFIVLHDCDRKPCCNPDHVRFGTAVQNAQDARSRGLLDHVPKPRGQKGELNCRAKASDAEMKEIKWLSTNKEWYSQEIALRFSLIEALATFFQKTVASLKQMQRFENWWHIESKKPLKIPEVSDFPPDAKPPEPKMDGPIGPENAAQILREFPKAKHRGKFVKGWALDLDVSINAIYDVLKGKTWKKVAPELARYPDQGHGMTKLSERAVQQIRATCDANPSLLKKGLYAALARKLETTTTWVSFIHKRVSRIEVDDDPTEIIPLEELEFKALTQKGEKHRLAKLTDLQRLQIMIRRDAGEKAVTLAQNFGVTYATINNIWNGKVPEHVRKQFEQFKETGIMPANGENGPEHGNGPGEQAGDQEEKS